MSKKLGKEILDWILHVGIALVAGILIIVFVGRLSIVEGNSMSPTLQSRDVVIIESITPRFGTIKNGDIVVLKIPELLGGNKKYAIKRVIAKEGQSIEIKDGMVYVDGAKITEPYINNVDTLAGNSLYTNITVPQGCIYVLGDNRLPDKSKDSRYFGPVKADRILGKVWIRIYPFSQAGYVK